MYCSKDVYHRINDRCRLTCRQTIYRDAAGFLALVQADMKALTPVAEAINKK